MSASRKTTNGSRKAKTPKQTSDADKRFQDRLTSMLEWLADKDPVRAAKLIGSYLDDLAGELAPKSNKPAKG